MATTNILPFRSDRKTATTQAVVNTQKKPSRRPVSSATAINQHIEASVKRLLCDSCLVFRDFSRIAKYAGTREDIAISIIRKYIWDLRQQLENSKPPSGPGMIRRKAA